MGLISCSLEVSEQRVNTKTSWLNPSNRDTSEASMYVVIRSQLPLLLNPHTSRATEDVLSTICFHLSWIPYLLLLKVKVAQLCPTLCNPMDYTVHGILQARILEWVAFPFSRGSSQPRDWIQVSHTAGGFFTSWATREDHEYWSG